MNENRSSNELWTETKYTYGDPNRWAVTQVDYPDGGKTTYTYSSVSEIWTWRYLDATVHTDVRQHIDGLGRVDRTAQWSSAQNGWDMQDSCFNSRGLVSFVSNPYNSQGGFSGPSICSGTGTAYSYDALGRSTQLTRADGNTAGASYVQNTQTVSDETGRQRKYQYDGLGRLTYVWEPDSSGIPTVRTDYTYDLLNNIHTVNQTQRTYNYDWLSRLTYEYNPESGATNYVYNANGDLYTRTDARGATTTYGYDLLHRVISKTYNDGTPSTSYHYDVGCCGVTPTNSLGRITSEFSGANTEMIYSYDQMGRLIKEWNCPPSGLARGYCYTIDAEYDLAGSPKSLTYPSGRKVTYGYNSSDQLNRVTFDNFSGAPINYNYLGSAAYSPAGAPTSLTFGNGVVETASYNSRLQLYNRTIAKGASTWSNVTYNFYDANSHNNGNVMGITDNRNSARTQTFDYDRLNRLSSAAESAWGYTFGYDTFGNLLNQHLVSGAGIDPPYTVNANNQLTNRSYDAAGNLTLDSPLGYTWDAEGRMVSITNGGTNIASYIYGADGARVRKNVGSDWTEYFHFSGQVIAELKPNGDWSDYVYAGGRRLAKADSFHYRIRAYGNNCSNCGWQYSVFGTGVLNGYVIQSGDNLYMLQYQSATARGGLGLLFTDGSNTNGVATDEQGSYLNSDQTTGTWHERKVSLNAFVGKTISWSQFDAEGDTAPGSWEIYFADVVIVSSDGSVHPLYTREPSFTLGVGGSSGSTRAYEVQRDPNTGAAAYYTTTYYYSDHLGSSRLLANGQGWPLYKATYLPYGYEPNPQLTVNNYKFTGLERDGESGLDHAWFRQYSSLLGRWMSPDPAGLAAVDPANPQTWNRYAYVGGNPLNAIDPLGLRKCLVRTGDGWTVQDCQGGGGGGSEGTLNTEDTGIDAGSDPGLTTGSIGGGHVREEQEKTSHKITPAQCKAAQTLLDREQKYGTTVAAYMSSISYGDKTVQPFNSSVPGQAYTMTAKGLIKVDWFTEIRQATLIPGPQVPAYIVGKMIWTADRLYTGAPITNYLPFQDPVETHTMAIATGGAGFRTLFPSQFMKENCGK